MIVIGVLIVALGIYMRPVVPDGWATAEGTVVNLRPQTDSEGDVSYTTVVQYTTESGEQRTLDQDFAFAGIGGDQIGDRLQVTYNPANPDQERIIGGPVGWIWYIPVAIGAFFVLTGLFKLIRAR